MISNKTGPFLRVRKKTATKNYIYGMEGSPPRVRGKVISQNAFSRSMRITPACAGKSIGLTPCVSRFQDHPRVCGEKIHHLASHIPMAGSPPRVRGKGLV